jgi:hypothetical protein
MRNPVLRGRRSGSARVVVAVALALAACGGGDTEVSRGSATASTDETAGRRTTTTESPASSGSSERSDPAPDPASGSDPVFELLDTGVEPRIELTYEYVVGTVGKYTMTMSQNTRQEIDGRRQPAIDSPPIRIGFESRVEEVHDDGTATVSLEYTSVEVVGGSNVQLDAALDPLLDTTGTMRVTTDGRILDSDLSIGDGFDPLVTSLLEQLGNQFKQLAVQVPNEPVGVGASWRSTNTLSLLGLDLAQVTTFTLSSVDGRRLELTSTLEQVLLDGDAEFPGLPEGTEVVVDEWDVSGTGTSTVDLTTFVGIGSATVTGTQRFTFEIPGEGSIDLVQTIDVESEITAEPG